MNNIEIKEELSISIDPSDCEILGVRNGWVYLDNIAFIDDPNQKPFEVGVSYKVSDFDIKEKRICLMVRDRDFLKMWRLWIEGKSRICEINNHFCGVMGYFYIEKYEELDQLMDVNDIIIDDKEEDGCRVETVYLPIYKVVKWNSCPDFEHG